MLLFILLLFFAIGHGKGISGCSGFLPQDQAHLIQEKVKFQFYYETGCPYCINMYTTELKDVVEELAPYLDITMYPYGNGHMKLNGTQLTIRCQHDEEECYGNMLHACAIDALKDASKYVPYNSCMMAYDIEVTSDDEAADKCGEDLNVDSEPIKECAKDIRGFELLLHYGIETDKVECNGVPCWYVNGAPNISNEERPLKEILCDAFKNPPEVCKI